MARSLLRVRQKGKLNKGGRHYALDNNNYSFGVMGLRFWIGRSCCRESNPFAPCGRVDYLGRPASNWKTSCVVTRVSDPGDGEITQISSIVLLVTKSEIRACY